MVEQHRRQTKISKKDPAPVSLPRIRGCAALSNILEMPLAIILTAKWSCSIVYYGFAHAGKNRQDSGHR